MSVKVQSHKTVAVMRGNTLRTRSLVLYISQPSNLSLAVILMSTMNLSAQPLNSRQERSAVGKWMLFAYIFQIVKKPKSTLYEYSHTVCFLWENLTSRKGIGRFIWLILNSCLIASALCSIRVWWAAQSRVLEEWKIKQISWSKIPFIVLMIS